MIFEEFATSWDVGDDLCIGVDFDFLSLCIRELWMLPHGIRLLHGLRWAPMVWLDRYWRAMLKLELEQNRWTPLHFSFKWALIVHLAYFIVVGNDAEEVNSLKFCLDTWTWGSQIRIMYILLLKKYVLYCIEENSDGGIQACWCLYWANHRTGGIIDRTTILQPWTLEGETMHGCWLGWFCWWKRSTLDVVLFFM